MTTSMVSSFLLVALLFQFTNAAIIDIRNNCPYTLWAAAVPGGGQQLNPGQTWSLNVEPGTSQGRIWPRTNCNFDGSGRGWCQTGDCNGLLECQYYGEPPNSLAEYALNQDMNLDYFDVSLIDGFNVPIEFSPNSVGCTRGIKCTANITGQCPNELRAPGGCNDPCTVFKTDEYCCTSGNCGPTYFSRFFKDRCPDAYSYRKDDETSTFTCPGGTNYTVVFCPSNAIQSLASEIYKEYSAEKNSIVLCKVMVRISFLVIFLFILVVCGFKSVRGKCVTLLRAWLIERMQLRTKVVQG